MGLLAHTVFQTSNLPLVLLSELTDEARLP